MPVIAEQRDVVQIFEFSSYDVRSDEFVKSRRWATLEAIKRIGGRQEAGNTRVDRDSLNEDDMTPVGFNPNPPATGFQTQVR